MIVSSLRHFCSLCSPRLMHSEPDQRGAPVIQKCRRPLASFSLGSARWAVSLGLLVVSYGCQSAADTVAVASDAQQAPIDHIVAITRKIAHSTMCSDCSPGRRPLPGARELLGRSTKTKPCPSLSIQRANHLDRTALPRGPSEQPVPDRSLRRPAIWCTASTRSSFRLMVAGWTSSLPGAMPPALRWATMTAPSYPSGSGPGRKC